MSTPFRLDGKTALVTGASSGLGRHFALTLARAGANVDIAARGTDRLQLLAEEIAGFDGRAIPIEIDVTDTASIQAGVEAVETELGPVTILINNAGLSLSRPALEFTEQDYDLLFDTNTKGAFFVAQECARRMIRHGAGGRIVNVASALAMRVVGQLSVYSMTKAAMVRMTHAMALEWGRHQINVNALCPGYIETEMNAEYWLTEEGRAFAARFPRRRVGRPEVLDGSLMLLVADESHYINGSVATVDDGFTVAY